MKLGYNMRIVNWKIKKLFGVCLDGAFCFTLMCTDFFVDLEDRDVRQIVAPG